MKWKKIYERLFFLILLVSLFFGGWQLISHYFQQQIVEQQEKLPDKKSTTADPAIRCRKPPSSAKQNCFGRIRPSVERTDYFNGCYWKDLI